jgi:translation initiation factor 2B subunit (eIF-2B alpha/beta/delta family)
MHDDSIARAIAEIRADHAHGASWLAQRGADLLEQVARSLADSGTAPDDARAALLDACRQVAVARPSMASLVAVASRVAAARDLAGALSAIEALHALWRDAPGQIAAHLGVLLGTQARIVTISRSATVTAALIANRSRIARVTVLESRPGAEGVETARDLAHADMTSVVLAPDAAMLDVLTPAGAVVAGADAIVSGSGAANKIGTGALAALAMMRHVPVILVAETTKIAPAGWVWRSEAADPATILSPSIIGVTTRASLFERVPWEGVTLVTERGVLDAATIAQIAGELAIGYRQIADE